MKPQLSSTVIQLLFSFDQDTRVEKTLINSNLSTLMQLSLLFNQESLVDSCKFSFGKSHYTLCNYCSRLTRTSKLKNSRINSYIHNFAFLKSHQLSCNSCSRLAAATVLKRFRSKSCRLSPLVYHEFSLTWSSFQLEFA